MGYTRPMTDVTVPRAEDFDEISRVRELLPATIPTTAPAFTWHRAPAPLEVF